MNVCVAGLWHLGTVTAACLASRGHQVVGFDPDESAVRHLRTALLPVFEPGLAAMVHRALAEGHLRLSTDAAEAVQGAEVVWVTFDTPVDEDDRADVEYVIQRVTRLFPHLDAGTLVLISSQVPVGTTRRLEHEYIETRPAKPVTFAYSPENLRLGSAVSAFLHPDRVVVGLRAQTDHGRVAALFHPFTDRIEWMSVESAEMTKHAINAFLATSVSFTNEVATLCECTGADAKEVERGLRSEPRIGAKAYVAPGAAFAGGTLARDLRFLAGIGKTCDRPTHLLSAVHTSNEGHKGWVRRTLQDLLGMLREQRVAVWGLTYKPGTDTLRRSSSVELCEWLVAEGADVQVHDPVVKTLPGTLAGRVTMHSTPLSSIEDAVSLVVATEWPEYQSVTVEAVLSAMRTPLVLDPNRFLAKTFEHDSRARYIAVGKAAG